MKIITEPVKINEGFVIEKAWITAEGYHGLCTFSQSGFRCGYVGVPEDHALFGHGCSNLHMIEVHGGLTFAGRDIFSESGLWYFGFDCGHFNDSRDWDSFGKYFGKEPGAMQKTSIGVVWTFSGVVAQVDILSAQLTPDALMQKKMED